MKLQSLFKFKNYIGISVLVVLGSWALATGYFAVSLKEESEKTLIAQLNTWQVEIAKQMFHQQQSPLLDRIVSHQLESYKVLSGIFINKKQACDYGFLHYVVNDFGPVGSVQTCYSYRSLILGGAQSLGSFVVILFSLSVLLVFLNYRQRQNYQRQILASKFQHQKELADWARQTCHDMKSPLQTLQNLVKLNHSPEGAEFQLLRMATQRLQIMTRSLSDKANLKMEVGEVSEEVKLQELFLDFQVRHPQLQWKISSSKAEEIYIADDWARVITNVLKNSCEALKDQESGIISLSWKLRERFWILQITDNGPGIPASILQRLGQEPLTEGKDMGNGWGLYGAFKVAQKQGGQIEILSKEGLGTTINLKIPRNISESMATAQKS